MPREVSPQELANAIAAGTPPMLVDVREDWEREIGAIPGDVHIPMREVPRRIAEFRSGVVVYCHAGVRSMMVASFLEQNGLADAASLAGGIDAWSCEIDPTVPRY